MPSLLGILKLDTPVIARQPKVKHMDTLATRYCRFAWLPSNRSRMVTWIRSPLKYCCVYVGCIAANSRKASVSIGTARCYKGKAIHNSELVSRWKRNELVFGSGRSQSMPVCEESSSLVSLRNKCVSECLESEESVLGSESLKRAFAVRSQRLARVAVISRVRSCSEYLVVSMSEASKCNVCSYKSP
jgi:hypothetical protein